MARVLHLLLLGICLYVGEAVILSRIVGGGSSVLGQFPWVVSLRRANGSNHFCGGTIVTRQHVLTAAHCILATPPEWVVVVSGSISNIQGGENHAVSHIRQHPNYMGQWNNHRHDIAVLRLAAPMELSATQMFIPLPTRNTIAGERCVTSGWGRVHHPSQSQSAVQQYFYSTSLDTAQCQALLGSGTLDQAHLCAFASRNVGVCNGDSGGPLICGNELAGLISFGIPCANGVPDVFVRVHTYLDWIAQHTNDTDIVNNEIV